MKRTLALILAALLAASAVLTACSDNEGEKPVDAEQTSAQEETEKEEETINLDELSEMERRAYYEDDLPDLTFGGKDFRTASRADYEGMETTIWVEGEKGEILNDALYARNRVVEERFDIKMVDLFIQYNDAYRGAIPILVQAGEDFVDLIYTTGYDSERFMGEALVYKLSDFPYQDFEAAWWLNGENIKYGIYGHVMCAIGDASLHSLKNAACYYFNRTKGVDYGIDESIYSTVNEGGWTWEYFTSLTRDVYEDLNGSNERDAGDFFGFVTNDYDDLRGYSHAFNCPMTAVDEDGTPSCVYMTERTINAIDMLNSFLWNTDGAFVAMNKEASLPYFINSQTLFVFSTLNSAYTQDLRNMTDQYGILPMPKYDAEQESYRTYTYPYYFSVPITVALENTEMVSLILEALNIESYKNLYYTYYVEALQNKFTRDEESVAMIDIIVQGRSVDYAELFTDATNQMRWDLPTQVGKNQNFFVSWHTKSYEKMGAALPEFFTEILERYEEKGL